MYFIGWLHWELRTNKRADILRIGTHHARIAFDVLQTFISSQQS